MFSYAEGEPRASLVAEAEPEAEPDDCLGGVGGAEAAGVLPAPTPVVPPIPASSGAASGPKKHNPALHPKVSSVKLLEEKWALNDLGTNLSAEVFGPQIDYWTQSQWFQKIVLSIVLLNSLTLGFEPDYKGLTEGGDIMFVATEHAFAFFFSVELLLHFIVEGPRLYLSQQRNQLDFILVICTVADVWVINPIVGDSVNMRGYLVVRLARLTRIGRVVRVLSHFKQLALLIDGFMNSVRTLIWAFLFLILVLYVFSIFARKIIGEADACDEIGSPPGCNAAMAPAFIFNEDIGDQQGLFGSMTRTMITLSVCMVEGCGDDVARPTVLKFPALALFWVVFIFTTTFGILNLLIGLFCENAKFNSEQREQRIARDRDEQRHQLLEHLLRIFMSFSSDGDEIVTRNEYIRGVRENAELADILVELNVEGEALLDIINVEECRSITFEQFFEGLMLIMKGYTTAKAKDLVGVQLTFQALLRSVRHMEQEMFFLQKETEGKHMDIRSLESLLADSQETAQELEPQLVDLEEDIGCICEELETRVLALAVADRTPATEVSPQIASSRPPRLQL